VNREEAAELVRRYAKRLSGAENLKDYGIEEQAVTDLGQRMLGAAEKYEVNPNLQSFETTTAGVMLLGLREELLDTVNYCAMIDELMGREGINALSFERWRMESIAAQALRNVVNVDLLREQFGHHDNSSYTQQLSQDSGVSHE
jgi:hypothetical protein